MNISNWPINKIMQLPDWCFGSRWPVSVNQAQSGIAAYYDISEFGLPEKCVIWGLSFFLPYSTAARIVVSLSLGDQLPTTDAQFDALEPLLKDFGGIIAGRRAIEVISRFGQGFLPTRVLVSAAGRRIVGRFEWTALASSRCGVVCIISSIPSEVPDWLVSR